MYYQKHIFLCINQKKPGKQCCANHGANEAVEYLKAQLKEKGLHRPGKFRVSASACLGRCSAGPCIVIYPEGVWYRYENQADLDRIIHEHLEQENRVESLLIASQNT